MPHHCKNFVEIIFDYYAKIALPQRRFDQWCTVFLKKWMGLCVGLNKKGGGSGGGSKNQKA